MGRTGVYFFEAPSPEGRSALLRYEFDSGRTRRLAVVDEPIARGLTVSPDGKVVLFAKHDRRRADLHMLE